MSLLSGESSILYLQQHVDEQGTPSVSSYLSLVQPEDIFSFKFFLLVIGQDEEASPDCTITKRQID